MIHTRRKKKIVWLMDERVYEKDFIQEIALFSFHHEESNLWMDQVQML